MTKVIPLSDRVMIRSAGVKEVSEGGIIIPDMAKEKQRGQGVVVAVGEGRYNEHGVLLPMKIKVDDKVIYGKMAGSEITVDHIDYVIVRESDVLAVMV